MFDLLFGRKHDLISPAEAKERIGRGNGVVLLDVRTREEYEQVRIPGSVLIPLDTIGSNISKVIPNKDTEIIVYCRSGMRAKAASAQLKGMGYSNVKNLGGINSWTYETVSGK